MTTEEVYALVKLVIEQSRKNAYDDIAEKLDDAMHLGSSGLEILGAIKIVFMSESNRISKLIDGEKVKDVIHYVNNTYGN